MGIRGIDAYLRERKLLQTAPLAALSNTRLGIDAQHYIQSLLSDPDSREPLVASTGGLPLALTQRIENDLRSLDRLGIKPVFVFAGLPLASRPPVKGFDGLAERETQVKNEAWTHYENGEVEKAIMVLTTIRNGAWTDHRDVTRLILRIFRHRFVEYVIAPYMNIAQLAYLLAHPKGYIHAIYSSTEALLFPVDKVITSIEWPTSFSFVDKPRLLADLGMNPEVFLDMGILAGCSLAMTFPPAANEFALKAIIDMVKHWKSGIAAVQAWRGDNTVKAAQYGEAFMRARLAVKYSFILTTEGTCVPLPLAIPNNQVMTIADVPADIDEIFTPRLPDELMFYICRGLVSPQVVGWLSSGTIVEPQPYADSDHYHRFIKDVITEGPTSPRAVTLALLAEALHPQWKQRRVGVHYYFDPPFFPPNGANVPFTDPVTHQLVDKCSTWSVSTPMLETELRRQNSSTIDLKLCIGALANEEVAAATRQRGKTIDKKDEIVANAIWRFLDVRGFVNANHTQSPIGRAMHEACASSKVNDRFQEPLYIILEMMRAGVVHGGRFSEALHSGGPSFGTEEEQSSNLLIMRCLSVLPLSYRPQQWAGPLSRELLVFNSFQRAVSKALRQLFEAISAHILLAGDARRNRDDYIDVMLSLPFQGETNTGFGILAKTYLDATTFHFGDAITVENAQSDPVKEAKRAALDFVEQSFTSVKSPMLEVERGFRFWDAVMVAVRTIDREQGPEPLLQSRVVLPNVIHEFEKADAWLKPMRP